MSILRGKGQPKATQRLAKGCLLCPSASALYLWRLPEGPFFLFTKLENDELDWKSSADYGDCFCFVGWNLYYLVDYFYYRILSHDLICRRGRDTLSPNEVRRSSDTGESCDVNIQSQYPEFKSPAKHINLYWLAPWGSALDPIILANLPCACLLNMQNMRLVSSRMLRASLLCASKAHLNYAFHNFIHFIGKTQI